MSKPTGVSTELAAKILHYTFSDCCGKDATPAEINKVAEWIDEAWEPGVDALQTFKGVGYIGFVRKTAIAALEQLGIPLEEE